MSERPAAGGEVKALPVWMLLIASCVTAFGVRSLPWRNFLGTKGEYLFFGPDAYDHLRRITLGLAGFPRVPTFDSFYGYPVGTGQIWSPLFDYLITLVLLLLGGGRPTAEQVQAVGFWLSPVLAAATLILLYRTGRLLCGAWGALTAVAVLALIPGHILYSLASELDHHVAEPMVCLVMMHAYLKRQAKATPAGRTGMPWAGAVALLFAILIWRGSIIFWGVLLLAVLIQSLADQQRGGAGRDLAGYGFRLTALAALMTLPLCVFNLGGNAAGMSFGIVSWFHVAFLAAWSALFLLVQQRERRRYGIKAVASGTVALCLLGLLLPAGRKFVSELFSGLVVVGRGDPWLDSISELRSMLFPDGRFSLWHGTETLSLLYWGFPPLLWLLFRRWRREGYRDPGLSLFMVWGGFFWLLPVFRERYVHITAVVIALGYGYLATELHARLRTRLGGGRLVLPGVVAGILLLLSPCAGFVGQLRTYGLPEKERSDLPLALAWLRERTPVPTGFMQPASRPEYGVLADWGLGAYIDYVAQRPTVATNFGWETHGLFESASFLTTTDPEAAAGIIRRNRVRYLLLNEVTGQLPDLQAIAEFGLKTGRSPLERITPFKPLASMYYRLYIQDGSAFKVQDAAVGALGTYRLVYESPGRFVDPMVGLVSHYKIFSCVPGAVLAGTAPPGALVELGLRLRSTVGRQFSYRDWRRADEAGRFSFRVPYPTDPGTGDVQADGLYLVSVDGRETRYTVSERDVQSGNTARATAGQ